MATIPKNSSDTSIQTLLKNTKSPDPGTATIARAALDKKMDAWWELLEARELEEKKRRRRITASNFLEALGFLLAGASAFCWFWSAVQVDPAQAAVWNARAAACACLVTLILIGFRGKSNINAKGKEEVRKEITIALLDVNRKQKLIDEKINELEKKLDNLDASKDIGVSSEDELLMASAPSTQ